MPATTSAAADTNSANPFAVFETPAAAPAGGTTPAQPGASAESTLAGTSPPAEATTNNSLAYLNSAGSGDRGGASGNFHTPVGGATAFLNALKSKNLEKVAEATALRAPQEAEGTTNRKLFQAILDKELSQEDLDGVAKMLEGFAITGMNAATSTAKVGLTITKVEGTSQLRRTITMRKEKAGWKVVDISGKGEIKGMIGTMRRPRGR